MRISLRASNVTTEYDPYSEKIEGLETDHSMVFLYEDGNLRGLPDELKGEMRKYGSCSSLSGLKTILAGKELEWFWIDLYVVLHVEADNRGQIPDLALIFIENWADLFGINSK